MTDEFGYLPTLTTEHLGAASSALTELAALASYPGESDQWPKRRVRVGHIDHGAFLNLELRSFAMLEVDQEGYLLDADSGEVILAIVANHSVATQINTLLIFLSNLLARQSLTSAVRSGSQGIEDIDALALNADAVATQQVEDDLRIGDWRQAARSLATRARNSGFALEVLFGAPLLQPEEINLRVPLLRRIYNTQEPIRRAIDRVAGISLALELRGDRIPPEMFRRMQTQLDIGSIQKFMAHLMRDTFVCGNGYLAFSGDDRSPMRLLLPERVRIGKGGQFETYEQAGDKFHPIEDEVLHLTGAKQVGSEYGLSVLEPFIQIAATNETIASVVQNVALAQPPIDYVDEASAWLNQVISLRERTFAESAKRIADTLGSATGRLREPPPEELYFPGLELMDNAAAALRFQVAGKKESDPE